MTDQLKEAIRDGNSNFVREYVLSGGNPNIIHHTWNNFKLTTWLISFGANPNEKDEEDLTILHKAVKEGDFYEAIINYLTSRNDVEINAIDKDGRTPLHYAVKNKNYSIMKLLVAKGADINVKNIDGKSPIDLVIDASDEVSFDILTKKFVF